MYKKLTRVKLLLQWKALKEKKVIELSIDAESRHKKYETGREMKLTFFLL